MLWVEKYRPKSFDELETHLFLKKILISYNIENIPHLILYGRAGSGKRTLIYSLINHLYGQIPPLKSKTILINQKIEVDYKESEEILEVNLASYTYQDKVIVQTLIKEFAETKPFACLFKNKEKIKLKIILITGAESLSRDAQAGLRRTVEQYSKNIRIFILCNQFSNIIDPIKSRFLCLRVPCFTPQESILIFKKILKAENFSLDEKNLGELSLLNLKKAITLLQLNYLNREDELKRKKVFISQLDWENQLEKLANNIVTEHSIDTIKMAREMFFNLINKTTPSQILLCLVDFLGKMSVIKMNKLVEKAVVCDERVRYGSKSIVHLECFVAYAVSLFESK